MSEQTDMLGLPADAADRQALADRVDDGDDVADPKWAPFLVEMIQVLESSYLRKGMAAVAAFDLARGSVLEIAAHLGGRVAYLPRGDRIRIALRDAEIYRRCNGRNHEALAIEHAMSTIHIYRICKQQRRLHVGKMQGCLALTTEEQS